MVINHIYPKKPISLGQIIAIASVIGWISFCVFGTHIDKEEKRLFNEVTLKADVDGVNGTTNQEWGAVYQKLGKHYDESTSSPRGDLSISNLKTYLAMD